jgi:hypothetical protein
MFGPLWDDNLGYQNTMGAGFLQDQTKFGIIPKAIEEIFEGLARQSSYNGFTVYCSFL